jgi:hypothetical protein
VKAAAAAVLALGFVGNAAAQVACSVTVTGQNSPTVDVAAVASAVNSPTAAGDVTVCLAGTFDFGVVVFPVTNSVNIIGNPFVTSLRIVGLNDANGKRATIRNGVQALTLNAGSLLPNLVIENLRFVQPAFTAVSILRSNVSVRISGLHISGVQSYIFPPFNNARFRDGISVGSALAEINGEIVIADNVIDGGVYGPDDGALAVSGGVVLTGALPGAANRPFNARVRISDNKLVNWSGSGILAAGVREATIERNRIEPGAFANLAPGCAQPNGLGAGTGISLQTVLDSTIRDNVITMEPAVTSAGAAPACSAGLVLIGAATGPTNGNVVYRNRIRGTGTYAIVVGGTSASTELDNLIALNPVGNFAPLGATLFIGAGASGNSFVGNFPSIAGDVGGNVVITRSGSP